MSLKYQPVNLAELLKHPHPHIELRIDQYTRLAESFTKSVRAYAARATGELHARRDAHIKEIKIAAEQAKETDAAVARMKEQGMELMKGPHATPTASAQLTRSPHAVVTQEDAERKRAEADLNENKLTLASLKARCGALEREIEQKRAHIDMLRAGTLARVFPARSR